MWQHGLRLHNGYQFRRLVGRGLLVGFTTLVSVSVSGSYVARREQFSSSTRWLATKAAGATVEVRIRFSVFGLRRPAGSFKL